MAMTEKQLKRIKNAAAEGFTKPQICLMLEVGLDEFRDTPSALKAYETGRVAAKLRKLKRRERGGEDTTSKQRRLRASASEIGRLPKVQDQDRRDRCEKDLVEFLREYMASSFYRPFSPDQLHAIGRIESAIMYGGTFAEAMPRGSGKTTIAEGAAIWAIAYGHRRYILTIGSDAAHAGNILGDIKKEIETNDELSADFPEITFPVAALEGRPQRCGSQTCNGARTHIEWKSERISLPVIDGSVASGIIVESVGITGSIRGRKVKVSEQNDARPDFVILDDPQTAESAENPTQVAKRERIILGDIMGLAGHDKTISAVMPCTVIRKGDLADRFLDKKIHPEWQGHRTRLVNSWPENEDMWTGEYRELWEEEQESSGTCEKATAFYDSNRKKMDAGAEVANEHLYSDGEISALQHAYNLLFRVGEFAFHAEYQNDPAEANPSIYDLTPEMVAQRIGGYPRGTAPDNAPILCAFIDINYSKSGLTWVVAAFENDLTGWVVDYGRFPSWDTPLWTSEQGMMETPAQAIWRGLSSLVPDLFGREYRRGDKKARLDALMIDCGFEQDTVLRYIGQCRAQHWPVMPSRGRAATKYKLPPKNRLKGIPGNEFHVALWQTKGAVVVHNSDYWRVHVQKSFLYPQGTQGGTSIYQATAKQHERFARQISAEKLVEFIKGDLSDHYTWHLIPGEQNDLLDCLVGCYVAASMSGAGGLSAGEPSNQQTKSAAQLPRHRTQRKSRNMQL